MSGFTETAVIFFREGLEAALMLSALAAYLTKSQAADRMKYLYAGALLGGLSSVVLALVLQSIVQEFPAHIFASILMLAGAAVMIYVSGWIWVRRDRGAWSRFIEARAGASIAQSGYTIAALALLVVLREGAEIVLFSGTVARAAGGWDAGIAGGMTTGILLLALVFAVVQLLSIRLPLRLVFSLTSACLFLMALKFIGESLGELQDGKLIPGTHVVSGAWLNAIGFNPTWEAVIVQITVIALAVTGFIALMRRPETGQQDLT